MKRFVGASAFESHVAADQKKAEEAQRQKELQHILDLGANAALVDQEKELQEAEAQYQSKKKEFAKNKAAVRKELLIANADALSSGDKQRLERESKEKAEEIYLQKKRQQKELEKQQQ